MSTQYSNILLNKSPKKINNISENIIDILFNINEVVRELNSIDFCNPLGYILTKSISGSGLESKLGQYGYKIKKFINHYTQKISLSNNITSEDLEEIRLGLEEIIPDEELKEIIPGGDGILKTIQTINDSIVITNTILSPSQKSILLKSFINRLVPLSNPINIVELVIQGKSENLNKKLNNLIRPEKFREDLLKIIKLVKNLDKNINQIKITVNLINKIIKSINVFIKVLKLTIRILKKLPVPAKYSTTGSIVSTSSKVSSAESQIDELSKLLSAVSNYLDTSVLKIIKRIRNEILILLIGLNQLYENIKACSYLEDDILTSEINNSIISLNDSLTVLEDLFPNIKDLSENNNLYKGYKILILTEQTTDNNTSLLRRRVIVTNNQDIIEYEGTPTYSNKDQILIKEGQMYIDSKTDIETTKGTNNLSDEDIETLTAQTGMPYTLNEAIELENEVNNILYNQIQNSPTDLTLYNKLNNNDSNLINKNNIEIIKKIINSVNNITNPLLLQNRLKTLTTNLLNRGYKIEEINQAYKYLYENKYNIVTSDNNVNIN